MNGKPVLSAATQMLECGGCGVHKAVTLPMDLSDFAELCRKFSKAHNGCAKRFAK